MSSQKVKDEQLLNNDRIRHSIIAKTRNIDSKVKE